MVNKPPSLIKIVTQNGYLDVAFSIPPLRKTEGEREEEDDARTWRLFLKGGREEKSEDIPPIYPPPPPNTLPTLPTPSSSIHHIQLGNLLIHPFP